MAQILNMFHVDLAKGPAIVSLNQMFYGDKKGNRVGAIVTWDGEDVTLGGYCVGTAILANGGTVALTGSVSGNTVYVDLPQACYAQEGPIKVFIGWANAARATATDITTLVYAFGNVQKTETSIVIDPGTVIDSVDALIADIQNAIESIPPVASTLKAAIAPTFSSNTSYNAGDYVWRAADADSPAVLYRFTADHDAGSWTGTDVVAASVATDVTELKSALRLVSEIDYIDGGNRVDSTYDNAVTFAWNADKTACTVNGTNSGNEIAPQFFLGSSTTIPNGIEPGITYRVSATSTNVDVCLGFFFYKNGTRTSSSYFPNNGLLTIPADTTGILVFICLRPGKTANNDVISGIALQKNNFEAVETKLKAEKDFGFNAFNSGALGFELNNYTFAYGAVDSSTGKENYSNMRILSNYFMVTKGTVVSLFSELANMYVFLYTKAGAYVSSSGSWVSSYTVPSDGIIRVQIRKNSSNAVITPTEIDSIGSGMQVSYYVYAPFVLNARYAKEVALNDNLNNFTIPGTYNVSTSVIAESLTGKASDAAGKLVVLETQQANRIRHIYIENGSACNTYMRYYTGSVWSTWKKIICDTDYNQIAPLSPALDSFRFDWIIGKSVLSNGTISGNSSAAITELVPVSLGNYLKNNTPDTGYDSQVTAFYVATYTDETHFSERVALASGQTYTVGAGINYIRLMYVYTSANPNPATMTRELVDTYFSVNFVNTVNPFGINTDGEHPLYVAFGASTTAGAVHHVDDGGNTYITYSKYNFPDYVGKVLNLKTYNLAVGSTGFMERHNADNNFMDQIMSNSDLLSKAKLVTIMFGYGNDHYVGDPARLFPIGEYDDYYPFDSEGYHPTGQEGLTYMVDHGATLMGCLNWCIRYINKNYPYAQLIIIFGSPSANDEREITEVTQTEGPGVAPYKLVFADPFDSATDPTSINASIKQINTELAKLKDAMDIPIINLFYDGNAFDWYSTYALNPANQNEYALFSTKGLDAQDQPIWNSHPNDTGYLYFARFMAGKIISLFKH